MESRGRMRWRRWLPFLAPAVLAVFLVAGIAADGMLMEYKQVDRSETYDAMEAALDRVEAAARASGAAGLRSDEMQDLMQGLPYAGMTILVDADGQVIYNSRPKGLFDADILGGLKGNLHERLADSYLAQLLASLPPDLLDPGQLLLLQTSYAVQAEREHADIYHYGERLLRDERGEVIGAVAAAYSRNPDPAPAAYKVTFVVSLLAFGLYWLSLPAWVWLDARARRERAWLWAGVALVGNLLGVVIYLVARRSRRVCPGCGGEVRGGDNACPRCGEQLRPVCPTCHEPLDEGWRYCPRCAARVPDAEPAGE